MDNAINLFKQKGTTLLEAIVATAIIGIGFIAIFQMVIYSVRSIDDSSERTKINYLADMVLEDLDAYKFSENNDVRLFDALIDNRQTGDAFWELSGCNAGPGINQALDNAEEIIANTWNNRFSQRRLNCSPANADLKSLQTYVICADAAQCPNRNAEVFVKIYFGQLEVTTGTISKNLYFVIH
jgi:Tfp pilus assembly protein PilV